MAMSYAADQDAVTFVGAPAGTWVVTRLDAVSGEPLPLVSGLDIVRNAGVPPDAAWSLRGISGHARYVERREKSMLDAASPPLGRPEATRAALIPIRKSNA